MRKSLWLFMVCLLFITITGCAGAATPGADNGDYQETKRMVIDLLKSDDGKQAIKDILKEDKIKEEILMDQDVVKDTIVKTMTSKEGKDYWTTLIQDPDFSAKLAKTMQKQDKKVLKDLMNDPTYQEQIMTLLKSPDMEKNYLELMKTKPYRDQMKSVLIETMSSPLVASQLSDALKKAVQDELKKDQKEKSSDSSSQQ